MPSGAHCTIPMFVDTPPFDNNDVRMALKLGIDREQIMQKILRGHGTIGNDHPDRPDAALLGGPGTANVYDPDKAKFHLKKAGHDTLKVALSTADTAFPGAVDMVILYKEHLSKAGIELEVVREPNDGYWSNVWLVKPFVVVAWGARPTPDVMFSLAYAADAAWNESHYKGERFNAIMKEARAELDDVEAGGDVPRDAADLPRRGRHGGSVLPQLRHGAAQERDAQPAS